MEREEGGRDAEKEREMARGGVGGGREERE